MKSPGHPDNDEGPGCLGIIMLLVVFVFFGPPLVSVAIEFWIQLGCMKGWGEAHACGKHMIEWNLQ